MAAHAYMGPYVSIHSDVVKFAVFTDGLQTESDQYCSIPRVWRKPSRTPAELRSALSLRERGVWNFFEPDALRASHIKLTTRERSAGHARHVP